MINPYSVVETLVEVERVKIIEGSHKLGIEGLPQITQIVDYQRFVRFGKEPNKKPLQYCNGFLLIEILRGLT